MLFFVNLKYITNTLMIRNLLFILPLLLFSSCSKEDENKVFQKNTLNFTQEIQIETLNDGNFELNIGIWMFKKQKKEIDAIANWINVQHLGKTILEPINIIWVDLTAKTTEEANLNVTTFLKANNINPRAGSSEGYFGLFENNNWVSQYDKTWSNQLNHITVNNHGRIFLSQKIISNTGKTAYISTGAFSYENEQHYFISFKNAIYELQEQNNWKIYDEQLQIRNIISNSVYDTFDHEGAKVFINQ